MEPSEPPLDPLLKTKAVLQKRGSMEPMEPLLDPPLASEIVQVAAVPE